jgi:hypothetical protein
MPAAKILTVTTDYAETDLRKIRFEQTADVAVLSCYGHPLRRLRRFGHNDWRLDEAPIGSQIDAPVGVAAVVTNPKSGDTDYLASAKTYVVTALNEAGQESQASTSASATNDLSLKGDFNTVTWTANTDAVEYRIYEVRSGTYGYLGRSETTSFVDDNILADFSVSPPTAYDPFTDGQNPAVVALHEARLFAGRTPQRPSAIYGGRIEDLFNFDKSRPAQATDSVSFALRGRKVNAIQHLVSLGGSLLALTADALWSIIGSGGYISPTTIETKNEGYRGANPARPAIIDDILFYATARGNAVRTSGYTYEKEGYRGNNLSVFAPHFFSGFEITHFAWCETPMGVLFCLRNDGKLVSLTWQAEQEVWGWTLCETDGVVESICSVSENGVDTPYLVVQRTINGETRRYVERMTRPLWIDENWTAQEDAVVVDAAYTYRGEPVNGLSRLYHLEGMDVSVLADGLEKTGHSVVDGVLTPDLDASYSTITVGLPYISYIRTLPVVSVVQGSGSTKGRKMIVANAVVELMNTYGIEIGYGLERGIDGLYDAEFPTYSLATTPPPLFTGTLDPSSFSTGASWEEALVTVLQRRPLPMVVLGVFPDIEVGS